MSSWKYLVWQIVEVRRYLRLKRLTKRSQMIGCNALTHAGRGVTSPTAKQTSPNANVPNIVSLLRYNNIYAKQKARRSEPFY